MPTPVWRRYLRFWGGDIDADVHDEIDFHIDMLARELEARGATPADARRAALERFGDVGRIGRALRTHDHRKARALRWREIGSDIAQDLRFAVRTLRRAPGFASVAVLTLALGIGANSAIFSVVNAVLLRPLPYVEPERLASVWGSTHAEYILLRDRVRSFSSLASYQLASVGVSGGDAPERLDGARISVNLTTTLGVAPALGRAFAAGEDAPGADRVVLLGDAIWHRRFGGDRRIVGQQEMIDGLAHTVVGVMPPTFHFPAATTQLWVPDELAPSSSGAFWGSGGLHLIARLRPGATRDAARAEVREVAREIRHENPVWDPGASYGSEADVVPLQRAMAGAARPMLLVLLGVVALVLLVACANVANRLLVRAAARRREFAIRSALGGGGWRLGRQLLTESLLLALLGALAGLGLAWVASRVLVAMLPADVPRAEHIAIDSRVLAFTALLALLTGLLFGALPALRIGRRGALGALGERARGSSSGASQQRLSGALVAGEIALAVILVIGAELLVRSFAELRRVDPGFRPEQVVAAMITPPGHRYDDPARQRAFYDALLPRIGALPGVRSAAASSALPLVGGAYDLAIRVEAQFEDVHHQLPMSDHYQVITPGYLRTMGIALRRGRDFTDADRAGAPDVVMVSESLARRFWPGRDPIGQRIGYPWESPWLTVVGVVADVKQDSLAGAGETSVYRPFAQAPTPAMMLIVRTDADERALATAIRSAVAQVDPDAPVSDVVTMREVLAGSIARPRFAMLLVAVFAAVALMLGVIGTYGVMSYVVAQRTREIGIRIALGATPRDALRLALARGAALTTIGVIAGLAGALVAGRALSSLLYGVSVTDPLTFITVPLALLAVGLLASWLPARRATRVDPTLALRAE